MPTLERNDRAPGPAITGFAGTLIKVDGIVRPGGVILTPGAAFDWDGRDFEQAVCDPRPEFIILGTGPMLERPAPGACCAPRAAGSAPRCDRFEVVVKCSGICFPAKALDSRSDGMAISIARQHPQDGIGD
jgi:hypothetical protein